MYRTTTVQVQAGDDSNLQSKLFDRACTFFQTKDLETFSTTIRVAPGAADASVPIAPVAQGYFIAVFSDYPVMYRLNGVSATQQTMVTNGQPVVNNGAPAPDQCLLISTQLVTSLYLQPIASAAQTANVRVFVSGDPLSAYI
jgi:hypothetical protein